MPVGGYLTKYGRASPGRRYGGSLLNRYCQQLGNIVDRQRAEMALNAGRVAADLARVTAVGAMLDAQTANRAKSEFLANISHELRTPLNAIIGFSEVMSQEVLGPIGTPRYREYANDIQGSAQHLLRIINDILDISQVEAGRMELRDEWVDFRQLIGSCIILVGDRAKRGHLTIGSQFSHEPFLLRVDERLLKQIVINLLSNAVKFTPPGGTIKIQFLLLPNGRAQLRISDTGIGIAASDLNDVFEPFVQIDSALSRKYEGTGLGLSLTRRFVELHDGTIALESTLGAGTTAIVELPQERVSGPKPGMTGDAEAILSTNSGFAVGAAR